MRQRYPVYPNILKTHFLPGWDQSKLQQFSIRHTKKSLTVVVYFNKLINFKMQVHANISSDGSKAICQCHCKYKCHKMETKCL